MLRTFGCLCFPYLRDYAPNKLSPKSSPCVFLGYSPLHKGFRCFDRKTQSMSLDMSNFMKLFFLMQVTIYNFPTQHLILLSLIFWSLIIMCLQLRRICCSLLLFWIIFVFHVVMILVNLSLGHLL